MSEDVLFKEEQSFKQRWIDVIFLSIAIILFIVFIIIVYTQQDNSKEASIVLLVANAVNFLIRFLLRKTRLVTQVKTSGIYVRFPPLLSARHYRWDDIQQVFLREYNPLAEYGGWGIRIGLKGKAFNVSGNIGLQIVFRDGTRLLIGTNKPEEMRTVLNKIGNVHL